MAKKWTKALMSLALAGVAAGGAIAYKKCVLDADTKDQFSEDFEDEDFDLDDNVADVSGREYVTLNVKHDNGNENKNDGACESAAEAEDDGACESAAEPVPEENPAEKEPAGKDASEEA